MRTILTVVLGIFIAQTLLAQNDSLVVKLDDYGQLLVVNSNFVTKKNSPLELDSIYKDFYSKFKNINMNTGDENNYFIEFRHEPFRTENSTISIVKAKPESDKYYFNGNKFGSINNFRFKVALSSKVFLFLNSLSDFEKVAATSLNDIYNQFKSNIQTEDLNKRKPYLFFYESKKNKLENHTKFICQSGKAQDYIIAYPSFGMQMINSTFAPEITINVDFAFGIKGTVGEKFGFSTTFLFMPDKDDFLNVNTYNFVNANYYFKTNDKWTHKISIGYMFEKNGSDFSYNTWNGFWQSNIKSFGLKLGGIYTKNTDENDVVIPSIGFDFGF